MVSLSRRLLSFKNANSSEWINSKWGRRSRLGLLCGTVVSYPLASLLINGPLVDFTFPRRFPIEEVPEHLQPLIQGEYQRFLEKENRIPKDAVFRYDLLKDTNYQDTVASGSLGVRTGLRLALPFYTQFTTVEQVLDYLHKHSPSMITFDKKKLPVDWDSVIGRELAEAFLLSDKALRFIILRDFFAHDGYASLGQRSISWATWTTFSGIFTYWLHKSVRLFGGTGLAFLGFYAVFTGAAYYANKHWHYLYRYVTDVYSDSTSAHTSFEHSEGGREFYWKQLKRNRLLRDLHPHLYTRITASGDVRGIPTPVITRFDHLKDLTIEDDQLRDVVGGDF